MVMFGPKGEGECDTLYQEVLSFALFCFLFSKYFLILDSRI